MGKHPTSITGIKIPLPIGTGWGRYLPAILNSGFQDGATEAVLRERQGGRRHIRNKGAKGQQRVCVNRLARSSSTRASRGCVGLSRFLAGPRGKKQFFERARGQEAHKKRRRQGVATYVGSVARSISTRALRSCVGLVRFLAGPCKKQFYESAKGQEALRRQPLRVPLNASVSTVAT